MKATKLTFEISAVCNARCPYCVTGTGINPRVPENERFLTPLRAAAAVDFLLKENIITRETPIDLYNWGEPFLNPELNEVLHVFAGRGMRYNLSTNGSLYRPLDTPGLAGLNQIYFSFPGFSQSSYDRIHGFSFKKIKNNVESLVRDIRSASPGTQLIMSFHIYQFNLLEIAPAREWCKQLGIAFFPYTACWNGYELSRRYRQGLVEGSRDLILGYEDTAIEARKETPYRCMQWDTLTLDQTGRVALCCVMDTGNPDFAFKDVLTCSAEEIQQWKTSRPVCDECLSLGISQWVFTGILQNWEAVVSQKGSSNQIAEPGQLELRLEEARHLEQHKYESTLSWRLTRPLRVAAYRLGVGRKK